MKRVKIICEGRTEQDFCKTILCNHFINFDIQILHPLIRKSKGGIINWKGLKKEVIQHLKQDKDAYVTLFIDYYGMKKKQNFPNWDITEAIIDKNVRMEELERGMKYDIDDKYRHRFLPYIQLYEFEGLLFIHEQVFTKIFTSNEIKIDEIKQTIEEFPNPELINNSPKTAPSKRLNNAIESYDKVLHGNLLAEEIGLPAIREKCPRFNQWIKMIENLSDK